MSSIIQANQIQLALALKQDLPFYSSQILKIGLAGGGLSSFEMNRAQLHLDNLANEQLHKQGKVRVIVVKGRKMGVSTYVGARGFQRVSHHKGVTARIVAHNAETTDILFKMAKRFYDNAPDKHRPHLGKSNAKELRFDLLDSGYEVSTAGNKNAGRGSTIHFLHASEVAFWEHGHELALGLIQAVGENNGTEIFLESTANGIGNLFHSIWQEAQAGEGDYIPVFLPWFWHTDSHAELEEGFCLSEEEEHLKRAYQLADTQVLWRRKKIHFFESAGKDGEVAFKQEYPFVAAEAFQMSLIDSFIPPALVMKARKHKAMANGPLVLGIDPAASEVIQKGDSTALIRRQGDKAFGLEYYKYGDTMANVGHVANIIQKEKPARVFIDRGGIGKGMYDRLVEMFGKQLIKGIDFGSTKILLQPQFYFNKRAEMWAMMKEWLRECECEIPDSDQLHSELVSVSFHQRQFDSSGKLQLMSKADMKSKGLSSPDGGDALALTFAMPVRMEANYMPEITNYGYR